MEFDATFWVAISFVIFFVGLVYLKVPQKVNDLLTKMIVDIKKEIDESEKLRTESKELLVKAKNKLDSAEKEKKRIIDDAKSDAERLIIEMNDKFHKSSELKKNLAQNKINQMKDNAIKDIKNTSIKIAIDSVKKVITSSVDKTKLDALFAQNLKDTLEQIKKLNS